MIIGNEAAVSLLRSCLSSRKPCLVYGLKGVGKQTAIRNLLDTDGVSYHSICGNDDIQTVKEALSTSIFSGNTSEYLVVDDADLLSEAAQDAMLKSVEEDAKNLPVILICHNLGMMSEALMSRFAFIVRFAPLSPEHLNCNPTDLAYMASQGSYSQYNRAKQINWGPLEEIFKGDWTKNVLTSLTKSCLEANPDSDYLSCISGYFRYHARLAQDLRLYDLASSILSTPSINLETHVLSCAIGD